MLAAFEDLGVVHFIGGSVASSIHGLPRSSVDADVVADLSPAHAEPFVRRLQSDYYVEETRVRTAIAARRSFNLIHLETMFKVDVFVSKARPYDREALARARKESLTEAASTLRAFVASPEDTILAKLEWFRAGGETSERQWADVVGILKTLAGRLDFEYMDRWAVPLGVGDLLVRIRHEAE